jgi:hypothetical protein
MRIWGHGLESLQVYCFDFVDNKGDPVNTPRGWKLFTADNLMPSQQLRSMEAAFQVKEEDLRPGVEKYVVSEGRRCRICIPGQADGIITIPRRDHGSEVQLSLSSQLLRLLGASFL